MGHRFLDQYSLLHGSVGVFCYFWNISLFTSFIIHTVFEIVENTYWGINIINKYFSSSTGLGWPGGKPEADSIQNIFGDTFTFVVGWLVAAYLDIKGREENWYYAY
jgi:hypothetical protein